MKRFKELSSKQKQKAINYIFRNIFDKEIYRTADSVAPQNIKNRLKEIQEQIKFCGCCNNCYKNYAEKARQDSQVKEWVLSEAIGAAEQAYYPEEEDDVINILISNNKVI